jgi:hypothetical protein
VIRKPAVLVRFHKDHLSKRSVAVPKEFISVDFLRGVAGVARNTVVNSFEEKVSGSDYSVHFGHFLHANQKVSDYGQTGGAGASASGAGRGAGTTGAGCEGGSDADDAGDVAAGDQGVFWAVVRASPVFI